MRRTAAALALVAASIACRGQGGADPAPPAARAAAALQITLERRPCYGTCPVYRLTVAGDGVLRYEGVRNVARAGAVEDRIPSERVLLLADAFEAAGFDRMADRYTYGEADCPRYAADGPSAITSITRDGVTKQVVHDHGCRDAPEALTALEDRIDEVTESWRWTTGRRP